MYLLSINDTTLDKDYFRFCRHENVNCPDHLHYSAEIVCVTAGELKMTVAGREWTIKKGESIIIFPFELHSFLTEESSSCFVIEFSPESTPDFHLALCGRTALKPVCSLSCEVFALVERFLPEKEYECGSVPPFKARAVVYPLLSQLLDGCELTAAKTKYDSAFIEAVRYILGNAYGGDVSLDAVAKKLGYHKVYLSRVFKASCGMPYTKFVNSVRCAYAVRKMRESEGTSLAEIAFSSGFGSIRSFNREFKAIYGVPPSEIEKVAFNQFTFEK